jgi:hypothetical protein
LTVIQKFEKKQRICRRVRKLEINTASELREGHERLDLYQLFCPLNIVISGKIEFTLVNLNTNSQYI